MGCLVVSLTYTNMFPLWLTGVIVSRDVLLILTGFVIRYKSLPPPITLTKYFDATYATAQLSPTFISKVNTVVQLVAVAASVGAPVWNYIGKLGGLKPQLIAPDPEVDLFIPFLGRPSALALPVVLHRSHNRCCSFELHHHQGHI